MKDSPIRVAARVVSVIAVDDDSSILDIIAESISQDCMELLVYENPVLALERLLRHGADILLTDILLPEMSGFDLLDRVKERDLQTEVVLLTGSYSIDLAVTAIRRGASDFIAKPFSPMELRRRVDSLIDSIRTRWAAEELEEESLHQNQFAGMIGASPVIRAVFSRIRRVAPHFENLLITGEGGTGKELVAAALHSLSPGASKPLIACNAAAIPENLLESELFGFRKGAFSGAHQDKVGLIQAADGGTLFLDEIGDLTPTLQAKILRVVETREVQPLGAVKSGRVDIRLITATNKNLYEESKTGLFRADLFYRLSTIEIHLPPLRERMDDFPLLSRHFLQEYSNRYQKSLPHMTSEAESCLRRYHWPGNIRELRSVLAAAVMLTEGALIDTTHFPKHISEAQALGVEEALTTLAEMERRYVKTVLARMGADKKKAADVLGVSRATMYRLLKEAEPETASEA